MLILSKAICTFQDGIWIHFSGQGWAVAWMAVYISMSIVAMRYFAAVALVTSYVFEGPCQY